MCGLFINVKQDGYIFRTNPKMAIDVSFSAAVATPEKGRAPWAWLFAGLFSTL